MIPQITFYKFTYKPHTSFKVDLITPEINPNSDTNPDFGCKVTCVINRNLPEIKSEESTKTESTN